MSGALLGEWARLLARSFAQAGVRHAVICPGSRSTPFAWALAECPGLVCHSLVDERAAAFFALGLARVSGEPALVLSTSGSAAANFFPAIVEAALARLPLLVLTADRPLELQSADAAQTIDQVKLYGGHVRGFFDLGAPDAGPTALAGVQRMALQATHLALSPEPGPVHVNARARKPLEPSAPETPSEHAVATVVNGLIARGVTRVASPCAQAPESSLGELAHELHAAKRGLVVCGPAATHRQAELGSVRALAERLGFPLFAEATSGLRFSGQRPEKSAPRAEALDWLLRSPACRSALAPDVILRVGPPLTSSGLEALLGEQPNVALHVLCEQGHPDALGRARTLTQGSVPAHATTLLRELEAHTPSDEQREFAASVERASTRVWQAVRRVLARNPAQSELAAVERTLASLPESALLVVGNSLPVRHVDGFDPARVRAIAVASQRGANGIDGLVAGAAGSALAHGRPTLLLLGDVSLEHDLGGLAAARLVPTPLVVVVLDNDGGRIFEQLPAAKLFEPSPARAELWLTPPRLHFEHAAALFGMPYVAPESASELDRALARALEHPGPTLVHVRVAPHSARDTQRVVTAELELNATALFAPEAR